ncbi:LytR/AlgR family response regulator transcription factor [Maridesulfovibrio bastinii]|uniref:LytR/AlgR family response regulator transcription factor n=1 Tax=Maridesulfovibrio bastinii TaxID=47157 RepID=UPI000426EB60|nr:LytTR family DNA-binding domain-containing protein [Maridesulfovibrio bastinii]
MSNEHKIIRTILVDDELPAIDELKYLLSSVNDIQIIGTAGNSSKAVDIIREKKPDLVFLDIQMPGKDGFHVLSEIMKDPFTPLVIFITAYDEYAIKAFEENAVDYILKPVHMDRLLKSIDRVRSRIEENDEAETSSASLQKLLAEVGLKPGISRITVEHSGRNILLNPEEILYFDCESRKVFAITEKHKLPCQSDLTLERLESRLDNFAFFRANRSQLVNLAFVRSFAPWFNGKYILTLNNFEKTEITVSKARVKNFKSAIEL